MKRPPAFGYFAPVIPLRLIKPLTSLRFVFALMVFFSHGHNLSADRDSLYNHLFDAFLSEGFVGVGFFFVLSGFILSYNYAEKLGSNTISWRKFWWLRFSRVYPMYLATLLLSVPLKLYDLKADTLNVLAKLTGHGLLLQSFFPDTGFAFYFNPPAWSISDEAFFYLLFPLLILGINSVRTGIWVLGISFAFLLVSMGLSYEHWYIYLFYLNPMLRCPEFFLGILLYRLFTLKMHERPGYLAGSGLELMAVILFGVFLYVHHSVNLVYRFSIYYWLPIGFIIYVFSWQSGFISKLLSGRVMVYLGEVSFSFYLLHVLVEYYFGILCKRMDWHFSTLVFVSIWFLATLGGAIVCYAFVEKPARDRLRRLKMA